MIELIRSSLKNNLDYCVTGALLITTITTGIVASSVRTNADGITDITDTTTVSVPVSCSMTATIDTAHTATIPNGIYSGASGYYPDGIGKTTIATFCNDDSGYAIYAIGFTGDKYDGEDHTKLIGNTTNEKITTGTATSGSTSNWAMKLNKETDTSASYNPADLTITNGYDDYSAVPDTYTKVANYTSTTDLTLGSVLSTTYAAYITSTQVADTYVGKVKYTLVHPNTEVPAQPQTTETGKICYYANASDAVGTMGCQNIASSVDLLASNFSRTGYGFAGWSNKFDYATNTDSDLKFYGPMETITLNTADYTGDNNGLSLYAVWVKSQGNLQDASKVASVCSSLTTAPTDGTASLSSVSALTDQRDNQTYAIAKLADGKCWIIENLRLESTAEHNSDGTLAQGYGTSATYGNFSGLADAESANFSNSTTANSLYSTDGANDTINIGTSNAGYRFPRYNNYNNQPSSDDRPQNPTTNSAINSNTNAGMYSYGNYYTWHAAIADLTNLGPNNGSVTSTSICPMGWHLPTGGQTTVNTTADFYILGKSIMKNSDGSVIEPDGEHNNGFSYYSSNVINSANKIAAMAFRSFPNNFLYSGFFGSSSATNRGSSSCYWSSTSEGYSNYYSYHFYIINNSVYPGSYGNHSQSNGYSIRCLVNY